MQLLWHICNACNSYYQLFWVMLNSWLRVAISESLGITDCFSDSKTALARFDALTTLLPISLVFLVLCPIIPLDAHCLFLGICSGVVRVPVLGRGTTSLGTLFLTIQNKAAASSSTIDYRRGNDGSFYPWRWGSYVVSKRQTQIIQWNSVIFQKKGNFSFILFKYQ